MSVSTRFSSLLYGYRRCPYCLSTNTKDSSWKSSDEKAGRYWAKPVRCRNCHKRFVRLRLAYAYGAIFSVVVTAVGVAVVTLDGVRFRSSSDHDALMEDLAPLEMERRRAEMGDPEAEFSYGMMLSQGGTGEPSDLAESVKWLERAASKGHMQAQFELAMMYRLGRGTLQDYKSAAQQFDHAARGGHVGAQYHMGRLYRIGEGVTLDLIRAYAWFNRAAAQGHGAARSARDEIGASLKPDQIKLAQALSKRAKMPGADERLESSDLDLKVLASDK